MRISTNRNAEVVKILSSFLNKLFVTNNKSNYLLIKTLLSVVSNLIFFFIGLKILNYYSAVISTIFAEIVGILYLLKELNSKNFF